MFRYQWTWIELVSTEIGHQTRIPEVEQQMQDQVGKHAAPPILVPVRLVSNVEQPTIGQTNARTEEDNSTSLTLI